MLTKKQFKTCFNATREIFKSLDNKSTQFYERISHWLNAGSEYLSNLPQLLVIPSELVKMVFDASSKVIKALEDPDYNSYMEKYDYFIPKAIKKLRELPCSSPPGYMLDWALAENKDGLRLFLVELTESIQDCLTLPEWTKALLSTAGFNYTGTLKSCCNDENGYLSAVKNATEGRTILWLSCVGQECHLLNQYFNLKILNPWDLKISFRSLCNGKGERISRIYSTMYYTDCLSGIHGKGLKCLSGSLLDSLTSEQLVDFNIDWWPTFTGVFEVSKFSLPYLSKRLPYLVPETFFLNEFKKECQNYITKPIFNRCGRGINPHPTAEDLELTSPRTILMRRINYAPVVLVPGEEGKEQRKIEIRCTVLKNKIGELKMHCGHVRLMRPNIFFSNPHHNNYSYGGVIHAVSLEE